MDILTLQTIAMLFVTGIEAQIFLKLFYNLKHLEDKERKQVMDYGRKGGKYKESRK